MSTFNENERIAFEGHTFYYVAPTPTESRAFFVVKNGGETVRLFDITGAPLGLMDDAGDILFGLAAFPEGDEKIEMDFSERSQGSGFEIKRNQDGDITGIGTIDIRDQSRVHHFGIGVEPINIWLDTTTGWFSVQMRHRNTRQTDEAVWYHEGLV